MHRWIFFLFFMAAFAGCSQDMWDSANQAGSLVKVVSVSPAEGEADVLISSAITVTFDEAVDLSTIDSASFTVNGGDIAGSFSFDTAGTTATFTPAENLPPSTEITIELDSSITGPEGEPLSGGYSWSFTSASAMTLQCVSPYSTIASGGTFNFGSLQPSETITYTFRVTNSNVSAMTINALELSGEQASYFSTGGITLPAAVAVGASTTFTVSLTHPGTFTDGTENALLTIKCSAPETSSFPVTFSATSIAVPVTVTSFAPAASATNIPINTKITAVFSDNMLTSTLENFFALYDTSGNAIAAAVVYDDATRTATLTPGTNLAENTTYQAVLPATRITNTVGDILDQSYTWTFTTGVAVPQFSIDQVDFGYTVANGGTVDFGDVQTGNYRDLNFRIYNYGTAGLTVDAPTSTNPEFASAISSTQTITSGSYLDTTIRFTPSSTGAKTAIM
ncbi:MAG: Ig-like domain-containing protein, partial [Spirochaetota bacterium]